MNRDRDSWKLKTVVRLIGPSATFDCALCRREFRSEWVAVTLEGGHINGDSGIQPPRGFVCPDCVKAGPKGASKKMLDQAEQLESPSEAHRLRCNANLIRDIDEWATTEELNAARGGRP